MLAMLFFPKAHSQEALGEGQDWMTSIDGDAQQKESDSLQIDTQEKDLGSLDVALDSLDVNEELESLVREATDTGTVRIFLTEDSIRTHMESKGKERFIPNPKKALWLAIVFPGGGQIYNRKYWKLPLLYGGFVGCLYALNWNNTMYRDYSQAYIDIMDSDENTKSYENFISPRYDVEANKTRLQEIFKRKKNYYRRFRDLSMFCMMGVYALSIIDAYVDAELSSFDISHDLTLKVHPAVINEKNSTLRAQGTKTCSYGLQCSLNF